MDGYNDQLGSLACTPLTFAAGYTVHSAQGSGSNPVFTKNLELRALVYYHHDHSNLASLSAAGSAPTCNRITGLLSYFLFFFFCLVLSLRDLSSQLGIEPRPPVVEVQRFNHWTSKEVPVLFPFD